MSEATRPVDAAFANARGDYLIYDQSAVLAQRPDFDRVIATGPAPPNDVALLGEDGRLVMELGGTLSLSLHT